MDNSNDKTARGARELINHLEEDDLWDLEDIWDEEEPEGTPATTSETQPSEQPVPVSEITPEPAQTIQETTSSIEPHTPPVEEAALAASKSTDLIEKIATRDKPQQPTTTDPVSTAAERKPDSTEETDTPTEDTAKKTKLSFIEKISLGAVAIFFLGLATWGYLFLLEKNKIGENRAELEFPIKGEYFTVSEVMTFWKKAQDVSGVKLGAQVIPAATITLADDNSGSGALRIYFHNAEEISVGDPITIPVSNGQFSNGEKSIDITATDGFHQEADYNAYIIDESLYWSIQVLEASNINASRADFNELLETTVKPIRK